MCRRPEFAIEESAENPKGISWVNPYKSFAKNWVKQKLMNKDLIRNWTERLTIDEFTNIFDRFGSEKIKLVITDSTGLRAIIVFRAYSSSVMNKNEVADKRVHDVLQESAYQLWTNMGKSKRNEKWKTLITFI